MTGSVMPSAFVADPFGLAPDALDLYALIRKLILNTFATEFRLPKSRGFRKPKLALDDFGEGTVILEEKNKMSRRDPLVLLPRSARRAG